MISKNLKKRLKSIEGRPLQDRASVSTFSRRDPNTIAEDSDESHSDTFESFFEYEEELSGMKSASEQYRESLPDEPFVTLEERESFSEENHGLIETEWRAENPAFAEMEEASENPAFIEMEEASDESIFIEMEEASDDACQVPAAKVAAAIEAHSSPVIKKTYKDVVGFDFVQCDFIKNDGNRCKRQAPKGNTICSTHRRYIDKSNV